MPTVPRLLVVAGALALSVASCGGSADAPRASGNERAAVVTPTSRPSATVAAPRATGSAPAPPVPVPATGSPAVLHTRSPTPRQAGNTSSAPRHPAPATSTSRPGTSTATIGLTAPGTYTYTTSGTTRTVLGSRPATDPSTLRVAAPVGTTQQSTLSGPDGTTEQVLESRADGLYLVDISISAAGFTADFHPARPVLFLPSPARVGRGWSWQITSTDGKYVVSGSFRVTAQSGATVGGTAVPCLVVPATVRITGGGFAITMARTECASTRYVLPVSEHSVSDGTAFATPYHADITRALTSVRPS